MRRATESLRLSRLLPAIRSRFTEVQDYRDSSASALEYPMADVLMSGFAMMFVQDPSMLEFQRRLEERRRGNNLRTIFGVEDIPKASQFRRILDNADPLSVQEAFKPCLQTLQKTRLWPEYRVLDGRYAVLMDGSEFFRSNKRECRHCLEFHHKDGRNEYAHKIFAAILAHPVAKSPIPLGLEEIRQEDGKEKQDCEFNAAKRLIPRIIKEHPHLDFVFVGDGLFSKLPMVELIEKAKASYILVAKPSDHKTLEENINGLRLCKGVEQLKVKEKDGRQKMYEWACDVELNGVSDKKVNWFSYTESTSAGRIKYRNTWVTDIKPIKNNIRELVEVGRERWQIENQAFDVLKNHGYHLEHNFGHGEENLAYIFVILNFLAYMLHQIIRLSDHLFQALVEKHGTKYQLWNDIRALLNHFVWGSWDILLEHMLDYRDDTGFDNGQSPGL